MEMKNVFKQKTNGNASVATTTSNSFQHEAQASVAAVQAMKLTTASNSNQLSSKANDSTITSTLANNNNSHADHSATLSSQIKKKSSSFLHRDYNRKPTLARSQVSKQMRNDEEKRKGKKSILVHVITTV